MPIQTIARTRMEFGVQYSDNGEVAISVDRAEAERIVGVHNANPAPLYSVAVVSRSVTEWAEVNS